MKNNRIIIVCLLISFSLLLFACGSEKKSKMEERSNNVPVSLLDLGLTTDKMINMLEELYQKEIKKESNKSKTKNTESKKTEKKSKDDKSSEENNKKLKELESSWNKINEKIKVLHSIWNKYQVEVDLNQDQSNSIEEKLNNLTEKSKDKNIITSLLELNQLNLDLAKLYNNYDKKVEGMIKEVNGYTREIMYLSFLNNNYQARQLSDLAALNDLLSKLKIKFSKDKKKEEKIKEISKAREGLKTAVENNYKEVIKVKAELIISRSKELLDMK